MDIGTICWFSIGVTDLKASGAFYQELLGWKMEEGNKDTLTIVNNEMPIGHMYIAKKIQKCENAPLFYITVESVKKALEKVKHLGANIAKESTELPRGEGFYAHIQDLDGNIFGVWSQHY